MHRAILQNTNSLKQGKIVQIDFVISLPSLEMFSFHYHLSSNYDYERMRSNALQCNTMNRVLK